MGQVDTWFIGQTFFDICWSSLHIYSSGAACDILDKNVLRATRKQSKPEFSCNYLCRTLPTYEVWLRSVDI